MSGASGGSNCDRWYLFWLAVDENDYADLGEADFTELSDLIDFMVNRQIDAYSATIIRGQELFYRSYADLYQTRLGAYRDELRAREAAAQAARERAELARLKAKYPDETTTAGKQSE